MWCAWGCGFVAGMLAQVFWTQVPAPVTVLSPALIGLFFCWFIAGRTDRHRAGVRVLALAAAGCAAGMLLAILHSATLLSARLPAGTEAKEWVIDAKVQSVRLQADGGLSIVAAVDQLPWAPAVNAPALSAWQLRLYAREGIECRGGERWRLAVRLRAPHAGSNPGVADFGRYLFAERVVASGYLRDGVAPQRLESARGWQAWRGRILDAAWPLIGDGPGDVAADEATRFARAVLPALVVDDRSLLAAMHWRKLGDTGTAHLVAISGLHVALLWGAVVWTAGLLTRRRPATLRYRALAVLPALALAWAYAALAGMPLPAFRAVLMLAAASACLLWRAQVPGWRIWLLASVTMLAIDPLSVHDAGFWLSYGAVALLLLLADLSCRGGDAGGRAAAGRILWEAVRAQALLSLLMAPMLVGIFGAASLSSLFANLPAVPLVNFVALPTALPGFLLAPLWPEAADRLIDFSAASLALLWRLLAAVDGVSWLAPLQARSADITHVLAISVALAGFAFASRWPLRLAAIALLFLAWPRVDPPPPGVADVCVLDVGEGLSVLVKTTAHAWAYDAGPGDGGENDRGASIVVPAARALGVKRLDGLVLSHEDPAHVGGAGAVIAALSPREILLGETRLFARTGGAGERCRQTAVRTQDGVRFSVLPGIERGDANDRSCILHVRAGGQALLVTGDAGRRREIELLERWGDGLRADLLVAGNHGGRGASALTFLYRVSPSTVVFATGHGNRRGHPHPETTTRFAALGVRGHDTGSDGAQCFRLGVPGVARPRRIEFRERRPWSD